MIFKLILGKYNKNFVKFELTNSKDDLAIEKSITTILFRKEYKPFARGFNKNITVSYLYKDYFFPIQFWPEIKEKLEILYPNSNITLEDEDSLYSDIERETFDTWVKSLMIPDDISLNENYQFQRDSVYEGILNKIGFLEIATSGGKTFIMYLYCKYLSRYFLNNENQKILIVTSSKSLCIQLQNDFNHFQENEIDKLIVETIYTGSKKYKNATIICGTFQSLANYDQEYFDDFKVFVCDEVHRAKAYSIQQNIYSKLHNIEYTLGMSGTIPKYNTCDYVNLVSIFGKKLVAKTLKDIIDDKIATPIKIEIIKIKYIQDADFSENLKTAGIIGIEKYGMEKDFFHTNKARTKLIYKLITNYNGNTLILVDTIVYCHLIQDYLKELLPDRTINIIYGDVKDREIIYDSMRENDNDIIIATYGTMSTGISIKNLEYIYFVDGGKSEIRIRQSIGRGMRISPKKDICIVFDFQDWMNGSAFKNHAMVRNRIYKEQKMKTSVTEISI
jgi:superfamily II DNA or RNA helicase